MAESLADLFVTYTWKPATKKSITYPTFPSLLDTVKRLNLKSIKPEEPEESEEEPIYVPTSSRYLNFLDYINTYKPKKSKGTTAQRIVKFFRDKGWSDIAIAGLMGNLDAESTFEVAAVNSEEMSRGLLGYGRGMAQWSNERPKLFERLFGKSIENATLEEQLLFIQYEVENRPYLLPSLNRATSVEEATDLIYRGYLNGGTNAPTSAEKMQETYGLAWERLGYRPYVFDKELNTRIEKSNKWYKEMQ